MGVELPTMSGLPRFPLAVLLLLLLLVEDSRGLLHSLQGQAFKESSTGSTPFLWWWKNGDGPITVDPKPKALQDFGSARYPGTRPLLRWDDLEARGKLGAHCDPAGSVVAMCGMDLVCRQGLCRHCIADSECPSMHTCRLMPFNANNDCVPIEKKAWELAISDPYEGLCTIMIFFASALAAAAGTGGGGMFVPLLVALSSLTADRAVPTSQCMILFASMVNLAVFLSQRHPVDKPQPVIDYDCVVLLEPMLCLGVMLGVMMNQMTPNWILLLLLCGTLGFALWRTGSKGITQLKAELAEPPRPPYTSQDSASTVGNDSVISQVPLSLFSFALVSDDFLELTNKKAWQVILTVVVWLVMLASSFHGLGVCTWNFMVFLLQLSGLLFFVTYIAARRIQNAAAEAGGSPGRATKGASIDWTGGAGGLRSILKYPLAAFGAGFLGGLLGLGGGIIMSPVLLEVGMHPEAVQATTAVFVFLSSSLASIQFARLHQHVWHYALWYSVVCVVATILGQYLCEVYVRKRQRYSLITLAIAGVLLSSLAALSVIGTLQVAEDLYMGRQMGFSPEHLCNKNGLGIIAVDIAPASPWPKDLPQR